MNIPKSNMNLRNVAFSGHKSSIDKMGYKQHTFYYLYDKTKYNSCDVELFAMEKDKNGDYKIAAEPAITKSLKDGPQDIDVMYDAGLSSFAYRFKLTDKNGKVSYAVDNGIIQGLFDNDETKRYNLVLDNRAVINKNGPMQLIMPDGYYPGVEKGKDNGKPTVNMALRAKALASVRTHANKLKGNFQGIIYRLPELEKEGISRIVGTPYTKDTVSSHKYWTENAYRVAPDFGSEEDFKNFQVELFKHGINWIADAALVNEGFGGVHISNLLRKGSNSYAKDMFRTDGLIELGVLPDGGEQYTEIKLVNAPKIVNEQGILVSNSNYNSKRLTYVQFYDSRLASNEQKQSDGLITSYDKNNPENNIFEITQHDDVVYPYHIEVSPDELTRNLKHIAKDGKVDLSNHGTQLRLLEFSNFKIVNKKNSKNAEFWDGNVEIPKLNFFVSSGDDYNFSNKGIISTEARKEFERGALAVRDYAVMSGKYWTRLVSDTQLQYVSELLASSGHKYDQIPTMNGLPASTKEVVDDEVIDMVKNGYYNLSKTASHKNYTLGEYITKQAMDLPLETIPAATNLLGVLTSPYIAKRANAESELGVPRFDLYKAGNKEVPAKYSKTYEKMDKLYTEQIAPMIQEALSGVITGEDADEYSRYVINETAPDLTKYLITKALNPDAEITVDKKGNFDFSKVDEDSISLQSLGIPYSGFSSEEEANKVVNKISAGLNEISVDDLKSKMTSRFADRNLNDFRMAEMILDRTESGLGWRIDAAKDVAPINYAREGKAKMADLWENVISFWKSYNQTILKENPHAYTTAEITDLEQLFPSKDVGNAEKLFLEETGITSTANYKYFFSKLPNLFADARLEVGIGDDDGWQPRSGAMHEYYNKLDTGWDGTPGFLFQSPDDGVKNSYTFVGNHDKPRILHILGLNQELFSSDLSSEEHQQIAAKVLYPDKTNIDLKTINFDKIDSKSLAMGDRLLTAFDSLPTDSGVKQVVKQDLSKENMAKIKAAISNLTQGQYNGKKIDKAAFGTRPFEVAIKAVLDEAEFNGAKFKNKDILTASVLKSILEPAYDKYYSIYKLLTVLPGSPTDFAGDKVGASGYETKAKNYFQQNRNVIHWEWIDESKDNEYKFILDSYKKLNEIANLRKAPKLSALNDGDTITTSTDNLDSSNHYQVQTMLRYNDKSTVLTFSNLNGANVPATEKMARKEVTLSQDDIKEILNGTGKEYHYDKEHGKKFESANPKHVNRQIKHGLNPGEVFVNANNPKEKYTVVVDKNGEYTFDKPIVIKPEDYNTLVLYKE